MLKLFAQFWLVLSLVVAPLPYAMADLAMADQGNMDCKNADQHSQHTKNYSDNSELEKDSCDCCDQCSSACSSCIHLSTGLSAVMFDTQFPSYSVSPDSILDSNLSVTRRIEVRPPKEFHA